MRLELGIVENTGRMEKRNYLMEDLQSYMSLASMPTLIHCVIMYASFKVWPSHGLLEATLHCMSHRYRGFPVAS